MAKISTLSLKGASGRQYEFDVYPLDTEFNSVGAVYAITKRDASRNHTVIYIGQTDDLSERFDNHHKASCFYRHSANCVCIRAENNEETRLAIEKDLIANYNPTCNG